MLLPQELNALLIKLEGVLKRIEVNPTQWKEWNDVKVTVNKAYVYVLDNEMSFEREGMLRMEVEALKQLNGLLYEQISQYKVLTEMYTSDTFWSQMKEIEQIINNKKLKV